MKSDIENEEDIKSESEFNLPNNKFRTRGGEDVKKGLNIRATGGSGTEISSGVFNEDHLEETHGPEGAKLYDKMERTDTQCTMLLSAIRNVIKSAKFSIPDVDDIDDKITELVRANVFKNPEKTWSKQIEEIMEMNKHGVAPYEIVHTNVLESEVGPFTRTNLRYRSPTTIEKYVFDPETEKLKTVEQITDGDLAKTTVMDANFMVFFSTGDVGCRIGGKSLLRACVGPWKRKQSALKMKSIGEEKYAVGVPTVSVPESPNEEDIEKTKTNLDDFVANRAKYIMHPKEFPIELQFNDFDGSRLDGSADAEDIRMAKAFLANFLELGMSKGSSTSRSFGETASGFYLDALMCVAQVVLDVYNLTIIPDITRNNFGTLKKTPEMIVSGINDKDAVQLAEALKIYIETGVVIPDEPLETHTRDSLNIPKADADTARKTAEPKTEDDPNNPKPPKKKEDEGKKKVDKPDKDVEEEKARALHFQKYAKRSGQVTALIDSEGRGLNRLMKTEIKKIGLALTERTLATFKKTKSVDAPSDNGTTEKEKSAFTKVIADRSLKTAEKAFNQVVKEIPPKSKLAKFAGLPSASKERALTQAELIVNAELAEIEKSVFFTFSGIVDDTFDLDAAEQLIELEKEMTLAVNELADKGIIKTGANNLSATIVNETRRDHMTDKDIIDQIESFTHFNPSPKTVVCNEFQDVTLSATDQRLNSWWTPHHHNCDSTWFANLKGAKDNPPLTANFSLTAAAQKQITLQKVRCFIGLVA